MRSIVIDGDRSGEIDGDRWRSIGEIDADRSRSIGSRKKNLKNLKNSGKIRKNRKLIY